MTEHQQSEFFGGRRRRQDAGYLAFVYYCYAVTDGTQLFQLGGGHDDRRSVLFVDLAQRIKNKLLRADVNTARWL